MNGIADTTVNAGNKGRVPKIRQKRPIDSCVCLASLAARCTDGPGAPLPPRLERRFVESSRGFAILISGPELIILDATRSFPPLYPSHRHSYLRHPLVPGIRDPSRDTQEYYEHLFCSYHHGGLYARYDYAFWRLYYSGRLGAWQGWLWHPSSAFVHSSVIL